MKKKRFSFATNDWLTGTPYRVVRPIGHGGMGEVYEVDHTRTGTRRAVKVLRAHATGRGQAIVRFEHEARCLQRLDHPNVVRVYEFGYLRGSVPYFAMELLEGSTLRKKLANHGALDIDLAVDIAVQLLDALQAVHREGMVHRDVKPSNIMLLKNGCTKLLDFGVAAHPFEDGARLTRTGAVIGTSRYMAPEQLRGERTDARTDIYAVGLVLFEMVLGLRPFEGASRTDGSILDRLSRPAPKAGMWTASPSAMAVGRAIDKSLSREPSRRFQTAGQFAKALRLAMGPRAPLPWRSRVLDTTGPRVASLARSGTCSSVPLPASDDSAGQPAEPVTSSTIHPTPARRPAHQNKRYWIAVAASVLVFSVGVLVGWSTTHHSEDRPVNLRQTPHSACRGGS